MLTQIIFYGRVVTHIYVAVFDFPLAHESETSETTTPSIKRKTVQPPRKKTQDNGQGNCCNHAAMPETYVHTINSVDIPESDAIYFPPLLAQFWRKSLQTIAAYRDRYRPGWGDHPNRY